MEEEVAPKKVFFWFFVLHALLEVIIQLWFLDTLVVGAYFTVLYWIKVIRRGVKKMDILPSVNPPTLRSARFSWVFSVKIMTPLHHLLHFSSHEICLYLTRLLQLFTGGDLEKSSESLDEGEKRRRRGTKQ